MDVSPKRENSPDQVANEITALMDHLPNTEKGSWIKQAIKILIRLADEDLATTDWKIISRTLQDLEAGLMTFQPYRHTRKVTVFGSARIAPDAEEYKLAKEFSQCLAKQGFMVMTGAGGGIMAAGNEGAGRENSFGLNIQLPFEQGANDYIYNDEKLIGFKYFFTRKLFFLRESDAIALFPGGYGTQDEAFECLTLCQTGKQPPIPLVLIDKPGGDYWKAWDRYIQEHLIQDGLVSPDDNCIYTITDDLEVACNAINHFYRVYHSSSYVGDLLVMRLNAEPTDAQVALLNEEFSDILVRGKFEKSPPLNEENGNGTSDLPRLVFHFNQRDLGRLYKLIRRINQFPIAVPSRVETHPEQK
ncbi:MAG: LOG family protein [Halothece sp. Uz-M2-17]|nr:LOG family protein [Halothece sp. Uz-M2-17]